MPSFSPAPVLFITTDHYAWGQGHMQRVTSMLKEFPNAQVVDLVFDPEYEPCPELLSRKNLPSESKKNGSIFHKRIRSLEEFERWWSGKVFSLVIIDRREPPPILIKKLKEVPIVVFDIRSILPTSKNRDYQEALGKITYVVNTLPSLEAPWANLQGIEYLLLPGGDIRIKSGKSKKEKIWKEGLLYLGSFTEATYVMETITRVKEYILTSLKFLDVKNQKKKIILTLVGHENCCLLIKKTAEKILSSHKQIAWRFASFDHNGIDWTKVDILFTHFGLLGLEAMQRGILTFFLAPTKYHGELVDRYFPKLKLTKSSGSLPLRMSEKIWKNKISKIKKSWKNLGRERKRLLGILKELTKKKALGIFGQDKCDLCGGNLSIRYRSSWMNLSRCHDCWSYCQHRLGLNSTPSLQKRLWRVPRENYDSNYFIDEYYRSYGRSYLEDEKTIKDFSRIRMRKIRGLWKGGNPRLLDIGCAYGFFLDVAAEFGCQTYGVDISSHAGKRVRSHRFSLGDFRDETILSPLFDGGKNKFFDIITLWYVIEHFPEVRLVLERLSGLQKKGGVLGLSTPNALGLSARYSNQKFLESSPSDHFYIFSFPGLKKLLSDYGYDPVGYRAGGIHIDRFREALPHFSWVPGNWYRHWASLFNLGDTMEVYFRKR